MGKKDKTSVAVAPVRKKNFFQLLWKYRVLTLMCIPAIVFFFMFSYMPMPGIWDTLL